MTFNEQNIKAVDEAMNSRHSIRAFLPTPVQKTDIDAILTVSARAASGTNTQPWRTYVVQGAVRDAICADVTAVMNDPVRDAACKEEYDYYPTQWKSPYIDRRRKVGWDLYGLLGLTKDNKAGMHAQHAKNYQLFDAPVGLFFTIDRAMGVGSMLDYGMFLQNVMVTARARGLDTCPQAAWNKYHPFIRPHLGAGEHEMLVCGMALGYADHGKIENTLVTERAPISETVVYLG